MNGYDESLKRHLEQKAVEIGSRIKAERIAAGYKSQADFMKAMDYAPESRQTAANWESGRKLPDLDNLLRMCALFNCEMGYLLCEEGYEGKTRAVTDVQKLTGLSTKAIENICTLKAVDEMPPQPGQLKVLSHILDNMVDLSSLLAQINLYLKATTKEPPKLDRYSNDTIKKEADAQPRLDTDFLKGELLKMGYVVTTPKELSRVRFEDCTEILKKLLDNIAAEQKEDKNNGNNTKARK